MGDPFAPKSAGDPLRGISVRAWNACVEAAKAYKNRGRPGPDYEARIRRAGIVLVRNSTGANQPWGAVLAISNVVITPTVNAVEFKNRIIFEGGVPEAADAGRFVVLTGPAPKNAIVEAVASGIVQVKVNVQAETDKFADVAGGSTAHLMSGEDGAAGILWREGGAGVQWAVVRVANRLLPHTHPPESWWDYITDNVNAPEYSVSLGVAIEVNGVPDITVETWVRVFGDPADAETWRFEYDSAGLQPMENSFDFIEVWPALVRTAADPIQAQIWIPGSDFPPAVNDDFELTPEGTPVDVKFDKIGVGTFANKTLDPYLRDYDAGEEIDDWIQVRCQPAAFVIEAAGIPIPPDGHTNTFFGRLADQPLPYSFTFEYEILPGRFKRMHCTRTVTPDQGFKIDLEGDGTGWVKTRLPADPLEVNWSVVLNDCPPAGAVMRVRYIPVGSCKWSWVEIPQTIEGGTLLTTKSTIGQGHIFIDEDGKEAHADPRNEVIYKPNNPGLNCTCWPAFDARGHCIGWWFLEAGHWVNWYSPWGFPDPGAPPT